MVFRKGFAILVVLTLSCLGPGTAVAAPGSRFSVPRAAAGPFLNVLGARWGPLRPAEGEIAAVEAGSCLLRVAGRSLTLVPASDCLVFVNGLPACLACARPVAPEAFFWAKVWLDGQGTMRMIEAVYLGGELLVTSVSPRGLTGISPEDRRTLALSARDGCLPPDIRPGASVYVLLDLDGRIRRCRLLSPGPAGS